MKEYLETVINESKEKLATNIEKSEVENISCFLKDRVRITFFVKQGLDSFLDDIIKELSKEYETKKIITTEFRQIDEEMKRADICWFEWCDELIAYGSKLELAKERKIICRLHRYEIFTENPINVDWINVDKLVLVTDHLKKFLVSLIPDIESKVDIITIANGVNLNKYRLKERKSGFNVAYVGYIHSRKNPSLLLQIMKELTKTDCRYKLYIAGEFQEPLIQLYWYDQIEKMGLGKNVFYQGWQENISVWLEDKNYIISTSIHESFGYGIAEAMARGIKPVIHNFLFANEVWDEKYLFNSISESVQMIIEEEYNSKEYRKTIEEKYSLKKQIYKIRKFINEIYTDSKGIKNVIRYSKQMLNEIVDFESINNLTLLIPTYNRASILKSDLQKGFKLGKQNKLIVDDHSDNLNSTTLNNLQNEKNFGIEKIIFNDENKGVAATLNKGIKNIHTEFTMFTADDDIMFCNNYGDFKSSLSKLNLNCSIIIPRYIINLNEAGELYVGYDRKSFNNLKGSDILKYIFNTGELCAFNNGAIHKTHDLKSALVDEIFKVSEDYVLISRLLSNNLDKVVIASEDYIYIRRVANNTLSKNLDINKLSLHLISLTVSGYYCLKNKLISQNELKEAFKNRGQLLQNIYGYGLQFVELLIMYIENKIDIEDFLVILKQNNVLTHLSVKNIPKEFVDIKKYI